MIEVGTVVVRKKGSRDVGKVMRIAPAWGQQPTRARVLWWHAYSPKPGHGRWIKTLIAVDSLKLSAAKWPPDLASTEVSDADEP